MRNSAGSQDCIAPLIGRFAYFTLKREEERLAAGLNYEPVSFYEKNAAALALGKTHPARKKPNCEKFPLWSMFRRGTSASRIDGLDLYTEHEVEKGHRGMSLLRIEIGSLLDLSGFYFR